MANILVSMLAAQPLSTDPGFRGRGGLGQLSPPTVADDIQYARFLERQNLAEASRRAFAQALMLQDQPKTRQLGQLMLRELNYRSSGLGQLLDQKLVSGLDSRAGAAQDELEKSIGAMQYQQATAANTAVAGPTAAQNANADGGYDLNLTAAVGAATAVPPGREKAVQGKSTADTAARLSKVTGGTNQMMSTGIQGAAGMNPVSAVLVAAVTPFAQEAAKFISFVLRQAYESVNAGYHGYDYDNQDGAVRACESKSAEAFGIHTPIGMKYLVGPQTEEDINRFRACDNDKSGSFNTDCGRGDKADSSSDFVRNVSIVNARVDLILREKILRDRLSLKNDAERQVYKRNAIMLAMTAFITQQVRASSLSPGIYRANPDWGMLTAEQQNLLLREVIPAQLEFTRRREKAEEDRADLTSGAAAAQMDIYLKMAAAAGVLGLGGLFVYNKYIKNR